MAEWRGIFEVTMKATADTEEEAKKILREKLIGFLQNDLVNFIVWTEDEQ
jgi:hypothetical protein